MAQFLASLRFRLIVLVLLAVIPAFGLILHTAARHRSLTANEVQRNALRIARVIAAEQERYLEGAHQLLITLAGLAQVRGKDRTACDRILASLLEPLYADLAVVDPKGNMLCSARSPSSALARPDGALLKRVVETEDFSIGILRSIPSTGKTVVELGYPVLDSPGLLRAVIVVSLDLSWVTRITAETHLYPGATFTLVDNRGTVLVRYPEGKEWIGKAISGGPVETTLSQDAEGTVEAVGADGIPRLFAFSQLVNRMGRQIVYAGIDIPSALAFAEANRILVRNLMSLGIVSVLALMAAWFGADLFLLRRIRDLVTATKRIATGDLTTRTRPPYGKGELGQLARAFDDLAEALERREVEAKASSKTIQEQHQRQSALYDINLAIISTLDLASVLTALLEKIAALFPYCAATVSWFNKETGVLEPIARRNIDNEDGQQLREETELGLPNVVLKCQSPLTVAHAQTDPRTTNPEFFRRYYLVSYLGLPMIAKEETLGVLSLYTKEEHRFSSEEMNFLVALANQAAMAVYNSRLYEQAKKQATELERSNKIKDEFLGVMSHELRTPLNIIMNYAEALSMRTFGKMTRHQDKCVEKIKSQTSHLTAMINAILEITKIEAGTVTIHKEPIDLKSFLDEMQSDYMMPMERDLTLRWEPQADLPVVVSDRTKLKHILSNLINNAIKFTEQGSVVVSVRMLEIGDTVEFQVTDTGPGIPDELIPVVFDKFRQIDSTTTRIHSGAGLGLYIVKTFTELLEGTVRVQSKLDEGSVFTVRLPVVPLTEQRKRLDPHSEFQQGSVT